MKIKAELLKPYNEQEKINFIVEQNHKLGYTIEEQEDKLVALGYTEQEKLKQEKERIALLNMTGADVERAIYKVKGIDFDDILAMVKNNPAIDEKALKIEFKANNFFRGNPYISQVGLLLGFTEDMLDNFFKTKDYHYLSKYTLEVHPTPSEAVITINGEITNKITLPYNTEVEYTASLDNYVTQTGKLNLAENKVIEIELQPETPITQE